MKTKIKLLLIVRYLPHSWCETQWYKLWNIPNMVSALIGSAPGRFKRLKRIRVQWKWHQRIKTPVGWITLWYNNSIKET